MGNQTAHRVLLITGAGGALGAELAFLAALAGWEVILSDRTAGLLEPVYDRIVAAGVTQPSMQPLDLAALGPAQCDELVAALRSGPGRLDALAHCAAAFDGLRPLEQVEPASWLHEFQVNVHAAWLLTTRCLGLLREAPAASLFFITDDLERVAGAFWGAYGVSKWAVDALAAQFAAELRNTEIRVLAIDPGPFRSPLRARAWHTEDPASAQPAAVPAQQILQLLDGERVAHSRRVVLGSP
jgi:NAD(P)-dependent dehydrogenase (short-subunit alcohol dehydrogenase family)